MARTTSATAKPLVSRGYGKILFATLVAMLVACGLMAYELWGEYGGQFTAARKTPVKVPSALPPPEKAGPVAPVPVVPPDPNP